MFSKSNRKYQYNHLSKDNSNATDKYRKGNDEKRQNLNFIVFHRTQFLHTVIKSQRGRDEKLRKNISNNRPTIIFFVKSNYLRRL